MGSPVLAAFTDFGLGVLMIAIAVQGMVAAIIATGLLVFAGLLTVIAGLIGWKQARREVAELNERSAREFGGP